VAAARFQIVSLVSRTRATGAEPVPGVTWRFLSANNRSLGRSVLVFPDVAACQVAIAMLRRNLARATAATSQHGSGQWVWRVRVAESEIAISSRLYQRRVRAKLACEAFVELVATIAPNGAVQVVYL
jgi:uncharacterized protein YegP (UPF0339 family)